MKMRRRKIDMKISFTRLMAAGFAVLLGGSIATAPDVAAQEARIEDSAVTLSSAENGRAELWLRMTDGAEHRLAFEEGTISMDGRAVGEYRPGGRLVTEWRALLREQAGAAGPKLRDALVRLIETLQDWLSDDEDARTADRLADRLGGLLGLERVAETEQETTAAVAASGRRLAIAPGGVTFDELVGQLDKLREALRQLGSQAEHATDNLAMIVHDDYAIDADETVVGNLALLGGTLAVSGNVEGSVLVLDGDLVLEDGARIGGDILQVGGDVDVEGTSPVIAGEIISDFASSDVAEVMETPAVTAAPPVPAARERRPSRERRTLNPVSRVTRNFGHAAEEFMGAVTTFIALGLLGLLLIYFAQPRIEMVADTVRHEFARSFAMGLAAEVLFFPALLVLCVLVITLPIVPFFVLGTVIAMLAGYVAVAHGAGEIFAQRRYRYEWLERLRRSNSYYYVLSGLVLLLLPFAAAALLWVLGGTVGFVRGLVTFVAAVGTWILMTAGFGSVLLTRGGSRSIVVDWSDAHIEYDAEPMTESGTPGEDVSEAAGDAGSTDHA